MSELDTVRWGDVKPFLITNPGGFASAAPFPLTTTQQFIRAQSKRPVVWGLRVVILPTLQSTENATFLITVRADIGAGAASATIPFVYTLAPTAGVYPPVITDFQQLPASDVNVNASCVSTGNLNIAANTPESIAVALFIAPITAFQGLERLYDWMDVPPEEQGSMRWMHGRPFEDDPLTYKPRR